MDHTGAAGSGDLWVHRVDPPDDPYPVAHIHIRNVSPGQNVITIGYDPDPATRMPRDPVRTFRHTGDPGSAEAAAGTAIEELHGELLGAYQNAHRATIAFDDASGGSHAPSGGGSVDYGAVFPRRINPATVSSYTPAGFDPRRFLPGGFQAAPGSLTRIPAGPNAPGHDGGPSGTAAIPAPDMLADVVSAATGIRTVAYRLFRGGSSQDFAIEVFGPDGTRLAEHHHAGFRSDGQVRDEVRRVAQWADQTAAIAHRVARLAAPAVPVRVQPPAGQVVTPVPQASPAASTAPAPAPAVAAGAPDYRDGHWVMMNGHPVFIMDATGLPAGTQPTPRGADPASRPGWASVNRPGQDFRNGGLPVLPAGTHYQWASLRGADLRGVDLRGIDLTGANLSGADLEGACLSGANLTRANLLDAILTGAIMNGANLSGALLDQTNFSRADLTSAILNRANLTRADLRQTYARLTCRVRT